MINIEIVPSAAALVKAPLVGRVVVVIDVLRCTTVLVRALSAGAKEVVCVPRVSEAIAFRDQTDPGLSGQVILGGERKSDPIEGFDLGNSPQQFIPEKVAGKTIVLTTTNGTQAVRYSLPAGALLAAALTNCSAAAEAIFDEATELCGIRHREAKEVVLACAGNTGDTAIEDAFCAALIAKKLENYLEDVQYQTDYSLAVRLMAEAPGHPKDWIAKGLHYAELKEKGYDDDLQWCLERYDWENTVPIFRRAAFVKR